MTNENTADSNLSVVLVKPGAPVTDAISFEYRLIPTPAHGEVKVQVKRTGLCGSDIHYLQHGCIGDFIVTGPLVLGHESSGIVTQVGGEVRGLAIGDRVAIEPGVPCGACTYCIEGRYNLCPDMKFAATPPYDGTLTNYVVYPAAFCHKLPDSVSLEEGALIEPLAVAVHAVRRASLKISENVIVFGAGPVGLLCGMVAKVAGAHVVMVDIVQFRLEKALSLGAADEAIQIVRGGPSLTELLKERGLPQPDVALECSGAEASVVSAMEVVKAGGRIVLIGCGPPTVTVPLTATTTKEIDLLGVFRYRGAYPTAIDLVHKKKINMKPLITHQFAFADSVAAFEMAADNRKEGVIKVQICH